MWDLIGIALLIMTIVGYTAWRHWSFRRPAGVREDDPEGVRSIAMFDGDAPELLADDDPDDLLVGVRLFDRICRRLMDRGIVVVSRGRSQNALAAVIDVDSQPFALVLEWLDPAWALSVEWTPRTAQARRHQRAQDAVYAPPSGPPLRRVLDALHTALTDDPLLSNVAWHRREDWSREIWDKGRNTPYDRSPAGDGEET